MQNTKKPMSKTRRTYFIKLFCRCIILGLSIAIYIVKPEWMNILNGVNFFREFSPLHIIWVVWVIDMVMQLIPKKGLLPLGSQKYLGIRFNNGKGAINYQTLREHVISTTKSAYKMFLIWAALIIVLGILYKLNIITSSILFLISVFFYVCDLICVLIWCPFRLIMKNRCCTTCRIFNWDHLMMFTPLLFVNSFFSVSLLLLAFAVWVAWELSVMMYPERFSPQTNSALKCSMCTDKLCTQYCQKLRK